MRRSAYRDSSAPNQRVITDLRARIDRALQELDGVREGVIPESTLRDLARRRDELEAISQRGDRVVLVTLLERYLKQLERAIESLPFLVNRFVKLPRVVPEPHTLEGGPKGAFEKVPTAPPVRGDLGVNLAQVGAAIRRIDADAVVYGIRERRRAFGLFKREMVCARLTYRRTPLSLLWSFSPDLKMLSTATSVPRSTPQLFVFPATGVLRWLSCRVRGMRRVVTEDRLFHRAFTAMTRRPEAALLLTKTVRQSLLRLLGTPEEGVALSIADCAAELNVRCHRLLTADINTMARVLHGIRQS